MNNTSKETVKNILPYKFQLHPNGRVSILNTRGQVLYVTVSQVANILDKNDLDVHRRRMYEAVLEVFKKSEQKQ